MRPSSCTCETLRTSTLRRPGYNARRADAQVQSYDAAIGFRVCYVDGDEEDLSMDDVLQLPLAEPEQLVSRTVAKHFPGNGHPVVASHSHESHV